MADFGENDAKRPFLSGKCAAADIFSGFLSETPQAKVLHLCRNDAQFLHKCRARKYPAGVALGYIFVERYMRQLIP